jgi:hypothetical protein
MGCQRPLVPSTRFGSVATAHPRPMPLLCWDFPSRFCVGYFGQCTVVGQNSNSFGVANEESEFSPDIFLCEDVLEPWEQFWPKLRSFG